MNISAVILAAGLGTRMKSKKPKVLFQLAGESMIAHVIRAVRETSPTKIIPIVGHSKELVIENIKKAHADYTGFEFAVQAEQKGTGHAVMQAKNALLASGEGLCFILCGDTPLLCGEILNKLLDAHLKSGAAATVLTTKVLSPKGYGRIVRDTAGDISTIVEERDACDEVRKINEINTGVYIFSTLKLCEALSMLKNDNDQHEYYLTDVIAIFKNAGYIVRGFFEADDRLSMGINNRYELAIAERIMRETINKRHMLNGVTIIDPAATYIESGVTISNDVSIYPATHIKGKTFIGEGCVIGPDTSIESSSIGRNCIIKNSVIEESEIADNVKIGPYSHLRPQTRLSEGVHVGNYVEIKKSVIARNTKANHLSYIGDASIGEDCNIGAGTITCNYDGINKNKTTLGDRVFIGSNSSLVAPIEIGSGALIAAGSVITKDVPSDALAIERNEMKIKENYMKRRRNEKK